MNRIFHGLRVVITCLAIAVLALTLAEVEARAQLKKGAKVPPNFEFGFEPGRKVFYEGIFRIDGGPKGKLNILSTKVESREKSVVIYTRQTDDAIFKLIATLDSGGKSLKDCPTHFVFLFADRKTIADKTREVKNVSLWQSNRRTAADWGIFDIDPRLMTMAFLVEQGRIKAKFEVMEGKVSEAKMDEIAKAIFAYAAPLPTTPVGIKDRLEGHPGGARRMRFSPDGKWLYSHGTERDNGLDARISKWELATGKRVASVESHGGSGNGLELTGDGKTLISAASTFTDVKFWDADTLKQTGNLKLPVTAFSLRLSPDDTTFAIGCTDRNIRLFRMADNKELFVLKGHGERIRALAFSPDSKLLVSGDEDGKMKLWNVAEGKEVASWAGHTNMVNCIEFSADGKWVASGGREMRGVSGPGRARLWDVETGKEVRELESTRVNGVHAVAFIGPKKLVIAGESTVIRFIDLDTGKEAGELTGHKSAVLSMAINRDSTILASGDWHATIRLWNVKEKK